jgi:hypothetical protein
LRILRPKAQNLQGTRHFPADAFEGCQFMSPARAGFTHELTSIGVAVLGIVLAAVPLALWIAWTPGLLLGVLAVGGASAVLIIALVDWQRIAVGDWRTKRDPASRDAVSDEFVAEVQRISPLTYHHARIGKARYREAMERLRQLLR